MPWYLWLLGAGLLLGVRLWTEPFIRFVRSFLQSHGVALPEVEPEPPPLTPEETTGPNKLGTAAFTAGVLALVAFIVPPATLALGLAAIIMGYLAAGRPEEETAINRGQARTGMNLGIFAIPWGLFWWEIVSQLSQNAL